MLTTKTKSYIYKERILLLAQSFLSNDIKLVGGITLFDAMDTIISTAKKLLHRMPSYKKINHRANFLCPEFSIQNNYEVITLSALNGCIDIQMEIDNFIKKETIQCSECDSKRIITINTKSHILIELVSIPQGKSNFIYNIKSIKLKE